MHLVFICFWNINKTYKHKLISQKSAWLYMCHIFLLSLLLWINGSKQSKSELISNVCMKYDIVFPYLKRISSIVSIRQVSFLFWIIRIEELNINPSDLWYFCIELLLLFHTFVLGGWLFLIDLVVINS